MKQKQPSFSRYSEKQKTNTTHNVQRWFLGIQGKRTKRKQQQKTHFQDRQTKNNSAPPALLLNYSSPNTRLVLRTHTTHISLCKRNKNEREKQQPFLLLLLCRRTPSLSPPPLLPPKNAHSVRKENPQSLKKMSTHAHKIA